MYIIARSCHACGTFFVLLAHTLIRTRTIANSKSAPVTYLVQFLNGGFSLSDLYIFHIVSLNFQRIVPVSYMDFTLYRTLDFLAC
jgi:hypothetical protein